MNRMLVAAALAGSVTIASMGIARLAWTQFSRITYSEADLLADSWRDFKKRFLDKSVGRIVDPARDDTTTSEAQSYGLLRAVWMNDKPTFDSLLTWTVETLQRPNDHLFCWRYRRLPSGAFGIQTSEGDDNTATDADTDIALALLLASARWKELTYLEMARSIIADIWKYEIVWVDSAPIPTADNLERNSPRLVVNPSYFEPAAYRLFAQVDPPHDWMALVRSAYNLLERSMAANLDKPIHSWLPPDWVCIDRRSSAMFPCQGSERTTNFAQDSLRVPWRMALDWTWNHDPAALTILERMRVLSRFWIQDHRLVLAYGHDGKRLTSKESQAMYGGTLAYYLLFDRRTAQEIFQTKVAGRFSPSERSWETDYYSENWLWFGTALMKGKLLSFEDIQGRAPSVHANE